MNTKDKVKDDVLNVHLPKYEDIKDDEEKSEQEDSRQ